MTYTLYIGDRAYSSWSLRGWLLFENFGLKAKTKLLDFSSQNVAEQLAEVAPARTVPTMVTPEGAVVSESLAIAEELASRHPEAGHWPVDPKARTVARTLAAEMATGFIALRSACPMNVRLSYSGFPIADDVRADLARLELIWDNARATTGTESAWLCGDYSIADAMFAPVAARIAGYDLPVSAAAQAYIDAHLADPAFRRWRAMGIVRGETLSWYAKDHPTRPWPGPEVLAAEPVDAGPSVNDRCPYSGEPVTHFLKAAGHVIGYCNAFCRDKTLPDPMAWPQTAALLKELGA